MRVPRRAALLAALLALVPALVAAQSLGEVAAREKARKEKEAREGKAKPPARVITETELRRAGSGGTVSAPEATDVSSTSAPAPASGSTGTSGPGTGNAAVGEDGKPLQPEKSEEELRAERQEAWRKKLTDAQAEVARLRAVVDQIQTLLNDMTGPLYGGNRTAQLNRLQTAKASLATAEQTVANLEDEGRRNRYR